MSKSKKAMPVNHIMIDGQLVLSIVEILAMAEGEEKNKAITVYLDALSKRGKAMFEEIHAFAIYAIETAINGNNDFSRMNAIVHCVKAMGNGARFGRLIQWFQENTPASFDVDTNVFSVGKGKTEYNLEYAKEHPYYEKPEVIQEPFSLENLLKAINTAIKRSESDKANPEEQALLKLYAGDLKPLATKLEVAVKARKAAEETTTTAQPAEVEDTDKAEAVELAA